MGLSTPKYPLYIISKGRYENPYTVRTLEYMGLKYSIIVECHEVAKYKAAVDPRFGTVLELPTSYQDDYDRLDPENEKGPAGAGAPRNFAWDHAIDLGFKRHWVMDDNIRWFFHLNRNNIVPCGNGAVFRIMEDFCDRYHNVVMAGPNYQMFIMRRKACKPFVTNTRLYSCNLILNEAPEGWTKPWYRWRGRLNEDTILSLDMLKDGWCTIQFNAFLQGKIGTQVLKGGNTDEFYANEGTSPKSEILVRVHPDVARHAVRYNRAHHYVDYRPFRRNKLKHIYSKEYWVENTPEYDFNLRWVDTGELATDYQLPEPVSAGEQDAPC